MTERDTRIALITGVLGQDGSYLAELLMAKGYQVIGTSHRGEQRAKLSGAAKEIEVLGLDLADGEAIRALVKRYRPHHLYNLAARASSAQLFDDVVATTESMGLPLFTCWRRYEPSLPRRASVRHPAARCSPRPHSHPERADPPAPP